MSDASAASGERVLVMAASTRAKSLNAALARLIAERLANAGESIAAIELADYELPLYNGDLEDRDGVPVAAHQLHDRVRAAEVLVIVSPEYNGGFTPLLKNTIDWVSRVDSKVLAHLTVLLASASPGGGGGARSVALVRQWLGNMRVNVAEHSLSIGSASLDAEGNTVGTGLDALDEFVAQVLVSSR